MEPETETFVMVLGRDGAVRMDDMMSSFLAFHFGIRKQSVTIRAVFFTRCKRAIKWELLSPMQCPGVLGD
jgi:hypothetical protein